MGNINPNIFCDTLYTEVHNISKLTAALLIPLLVLHLHRLLVHGLGLLLLVEELDVPAVPPDADVGQGGEGEADCHEVAEGVPHGVGVVEEAVGHLAAVAAPHQARVVCSRVQSVVKCSYLFVLYVTFINAIDLLSGLHYISRSDGNAFSFDEKINGCFKTNKNI